MSGILGLWNLDGCPVDEPLLARLSKPLSHRGPDGEGRWLAGSAGLACHHLKVAPESANETQPQVHRSGTVVVFDGRLDDREGILQAVDFGEQVSLASPDAALVLAAYHALGEDFVDRLSGDFALALFDPSRQKLILARDAIGVRPLYYYYRSGDKAVFASEIKAILAHPNVSTRPNDDLLANFLLGARCQDNDDSTFFQGIRAVPAAHVVVLTPAELCRRRYWDFDQSRRIRLSSFEEYVEAFREHLARAVARRLRSAHPVAVSVSGGLDSSAIFCTAEALRHKSPAKHPPVVGFSQVSRDGSPCDEEVFLDHIERKFGEPIERFPMGAPGLMNGCGEEVWHVESPLLDPQWNSTSSFMRRIRESGTRVLLTGDWGDQILFDWAYLNDLFDRLAWAEVRHHLREFPRWFTDADPTALRRMVFLSLARHHTPGILLPPLRRVRRMLTRGSWEPPWYAARFRHRARRRLMPGGPKRRSSGSAHARSLYREARSGYAVLWLERENHVAGFHGLEKAFPFLDRDLVAFLMAIPGEIQTFEGVPKAILRHALQGILPAEIGERRWKADFTHRVNKGIALEYPELAACLESDDIASVMGYVDKMAATEGLARARDRMGSTSCTVAWGIRDLLGLVLWLRVFFGRKIAEREVQICA